MRGFYELRSLFGEITLQCLIQININIYAYVKCKYLYTFHSFLGCRECHQSTLKDIQTIRLTFLGIWLSHSDMASFLRANLCNELFQFVRVFGRTILSTSKLSRLQMFVTHQNYQSSIKKQSYIKTLVSDNILFTQLLLFSYVCECQKLRLPNFAARTYFRKRFVLDFIKFARALQTKLFFGSGCQLLLKSLAMLVSFLNYYLVYLTIRSSKVCFMNLYKQYRTQVLMQNIV
eukprot:TRINITY_DN6958_c1_g1_i3.p2 TRINITY_DN6958_c1_g1~~TRINITY_DN6958_c1_g1_i3.p2  ORF type:complete len:232 (-),score=-5.88 TRINITY_DN6958_c1_g1_i3:604-1299(-)